MWLELSQSHAESKLNEWRKYFFVFFKAPHSLRGLYFKEVSRVDDGPGSSKKQLNNEKHRYPGHSFFIWHTPG